MKVLMFGWEFPPHISGGLGTACYGLTKGMAEIKEIDVTFVVPKAFGDEDPSRMKLIGANTIPVNRTTFSFDESEKTMEYLEVDSPILPYVSEDEFWTLKSKRYTRQTKFVETDENSKIEFSGGYGPDLLKEIRDYALVARLIAKDNPCDIIHAHDWLTYPAGIAASKASGKPLVIHVHATDFDRSGGDVNPRVYAIEREGMEAADKIIAVSNLTRKMVIEKYGISPEKVVTVYNAVDSVNKEKGTLPTKGVNDKVVTFLGRITIQKGPGYFVEAANMVLKKMQNARFVMAGSGDMMNEMVARTAALGIADKFHFTGFLKGNDVIDLFSMTDVFVMPSVSEPFGIVPLEAMQLNVPVIISNQSGVSEILKHAIKIDFWDTYAMADAIYGVLNYTSLAQHFKSEGKIEVEELKWTHSANEVKKVYQSTLQDH
ncbi:glycosyltransferase family 4 protein [Draconibacterium halophilum]|uniref:Glycosyltransferase family 4 protein n=1 Tax=Draconibacterium halophilum TaxID=2706887 RepID=A0A6C0R8L5_9BACT|nr:glycosyltransferase family 4 protein [Draconibacterium halophilum]QIA06252.1 glycosyltransferase family 4 protein [Draconibacterium halophilum]